MTYGIDDKYEYFEFLLDSLDNSGPYNSRATALNWPRFLLGGIKTENIVGMQIVSAEIPFSYYLITTLNNTFILKEDGGADTVVTLRVGNYSLTQMLLEVGTQLSAVSPSGSTYTATYNGQTLKMTVTATGTLGNFSFTFGAPSNSGNVNPRLYVGFPGGETFADGLVMVSPNALLLSGPNYIYINSQRFGMMSDAFLPEGATNLGGGAKGSQMARIPVNVSPNEIIYYNDPNPEFWFNVSALNSLQNIDFYLTIGNTSAPTPVDLNGLGFSLKLGLLLLKPDRLDSQIGTLEQNRVVKRMRPY